MKKARKWLDANEIDYEFHDYKKLGVDSERLAAQVEKLGWENLVNKRGTTWRRLADEEKEKLVDGASAIELLQNNASMIKRPILELGDDMLLGFDEAVWTQRLGSK